MTKPNSSRPRLRTAIRAGWIVNYSGSPGGARIAGAVCEALGGEVVSAWGTIGFTPERAGISCEFADPLIS